MIDKLDYYQGDPNRRRQWGWYLNLVAWILIIALLAAIVGPKVFPGPVGIIPLTVEEQTDLSNIQVAMEAYGENHGYYPGPTLGDAIKALAADEKGFIDSFPKTGLDAWGRPHLYQLSADGRHVVIYSCGPNGIDDHGNGDDIVIRCDIASQVTTREE
jgi:type II secretory pathway pseudopilin PulG